MPVSLSEVLEKIGDENISMQSLDSSITGFKNTKKHTNIEFLTDVSNTPNLCIADGCFYTKKMGLILWVDRKEYEAAIQAISKLKQEETK